MLALIDGDLLAYRIGYTTNDDPEWIARARLRETIGGIGEAINPNDMEIWLSDSKENFRAKLFPLYKANRTAPKPKHLRYLQQLLVDEWGAQIAFDEEADDALGIRQVAIEGCNKSGFDDSVIVSIDKDLFQIPGNHYNFVKKEFATITPDEGLFRFYKQILTGDSTDNIRVETGLSAKGIGEVKAFKILEGCETEEELFLTCLDVFRRSWADWEGMTQEKIDAAFLLTGQLIKIRTKPGEVWTFPIELKQDDSAMLSSSDKPQVAVNPS